MTTPPANMPRNPYTPPFDLTPAITESVETITTLLSRWTAKAQAAPSPTQRRNQRIRSIQASLAIENNSLSVEQVTAVLEGRHVLAPPRDVQEVRNAFAAYDHLPSWNPTSPDDLLQAHALLMANLLDAPGQWRSGGVGIYRGEQLLHMAPPANRVPTLMADLLAWLRRTDAHPLVASSVFHYEFEFIHPFSDGNGRMGRLWQTLILSRWQPALAWLPVETVIRDRQQAYYAALAAADNASSATPFLDFMLDALATALQQAVDSESSNEAATDQVTDQVAPDPHSPLAALLAVLAPGTSASASELMQRLALQHRPHFRSHYLNPALAAGWIEMTDPTSPRSPRQRYRRATRGGER